MLPVYTPPVLNFDDTIKEALLILNYKGSEEAVVVHIKTTTPIDGNEDVILRKLRNTGKYDTDQVVWLTERQAKEMIQTKWIEEVLI
jgi:hypothetical protein